MRPRRVFATGFIAAVALSCRSEETTGPRPPQSAAVSIETVRAPDPIATTPPPPPSSEPKPRRPSCLIETPDKAPPKAPKARTCPPDNAGNFDLPLGHVTFVDAPGSPRVE